MTTFDQNTKDLLIPAAIGNFPMQGGSEGITEEEAVELINSAITEYDATVQTALSGLQEDIEQNTASINTNAENISSLTEVVSGNTRSIGTNASNIQALSAKTNETAADLAALSAKTSETASDLAALSAYTETIHYELPIASSETLGGIKVGSGLTIDSSGVLSVSGETGSVVSWRQDLSAGTQIAEISINGNSQAVYAPDGGNNDSSVYSFILTSATSITDLYAEIKQLTDAGKMNILLWGESNYWNKEWVPLSLSTVLINAIEFDGDKVSSVGRANKYSVLIRSDGTYSGLTNKMKLSASANSIPTASTTTLGGVKVGSGLTIDSSGVLSVSGGTGGDSKYVVVEALSAVTNPVEGMIAYVPSYSVDNTYDFVKYQVTPYVETVEGTIGWLRREDTNQISEIYQSGPYFYHQPWEQGNDDYEFRKSSWDDPYDGRQKIYTALWRSYIDAEDPHNSWIEISTALTQEILLFDVNIDTTTTSLTSETITTYYSEAFYQYENGAWKEMYIPELFDFDKATAAQRVAIFNAIKLNPKEGDWNVKMSFFATFENDQRVETRAKLQFCDIYGNDWLFFSATFGKIDNEEGVVSAIIRLYSDGHYDKEVWALEKSSVGYSEISRDCRLQYDMALSAFTVNGSTDFNVTGNTCTWDGPYDWGDINEVLSTGNGKFPSFRFDMYPGNGDSAPVLSMAFPILSISSFSPAVTCTDRDGNQANFDREVEYNYGKYSIKLWASTESNYRYANIRLVQNS